MAGGISGKLTDKAVKAFVAKAERGKKLSDGGGLHLFITPAGGATWRVKYRIAGKEKIYSIGPYSLVSLGAARVELGEVKALLLEGRDPVTARRVNRAATAAGSDNTFKAVAQEWLAMKKKQWSPCPKPLKPIFGATSVTSIIRLRNSTEPSMHLFSLLKIGTTNDNAC